MTEPILTITLGQQVFPVSLEHGALCAFEDEAGISLMEFAERVVGGRAGLREITLFTTRVVGGECPIEKAILEAGLNQATFAVATVLNRICMGSRHQRQHSVNETSFSSELNALLERFPDGVDYGAV